LELNLQDAIAIDELTDSIAIGSSTIGSKLQSGFAILHMLQLTQQFLKTLVPHLDQAITANIHC
jgi:hypothetical protein